MIAFVNDAMDLALPTKAKFLLVVLADTADMYGVCYPSMATLSRKTCMPERTLQRQMQWLIEKGLVQTFWSFTDKIRHKKIQHFRLNLASALKAPQPDFSNCTKELRLEVIARFNATCVYCGHNGDSENGPDGKPWHIDRILPGSKGGKYVASNVTLSCGPCNSSKGAKMAPSHVLSLGAILNKEGCHSGDSVVPPVAPKPSLEPPLEPKPSSSLRSEGGFQEESSTKEKSKPKSEPDSRHTPVREFIEKCWHHANGSDVKMPWAGAEAKLLGTVLKENPSWTVEQFIQCVRHRYRSEVNNSDQPRKWLSSLTSYYNNPLDRFGKPYGQQQNRGVTRQRQNIEAIMSGFGRSARQVASDDSVNVVEGSHSTGDSGLETNTRLLPGGKD